MEIVLTLVGGPDWMEGLVFSRRGADVLITARKHSGADYGAAIITPKQLAQLFAILGVTPA